MSSRERAIPVQIHCAETEAEVADCRNAHGVSPVMLLDRCGALSERTVLAHGVWLDDADLELIAERGATVVTNPVSNLKLAVGRVFRAADVRAFGIGIGIGTDGASSNNALDLFADTKVLALIQKHAQGDPAAMPAEDAWSIATGQWAPALGQRGVVAVGEPADFVAGAGRSPRARSRRSREQLGVRGPGCGGRHGGRRRRGSGAQRASRRRR